MAQDDTREQGGDSFQGLRRQTESMYKRIAHYTVIISSEKVGKVGHSRMRARPYLRTFSFAYNILFIQETIFILY